MGRGRMVSGGGGSRGRMVSGGGGSRGGRSVGGHSRIGGSNHHTTVFIGGGHHHGGGGGSPIVGIIAGAIFVLVGIFIVFGGFGKVIESFQYSTVQATCLGNEFIDGGYYTTYEYTVNGTNYENSSNQSWTKQEELGEVVTIYYLKSDPNEIYEEKPTTIGEGIIIVFAGLICGGLGSLPLVLCVKQLKQEKGSDSSNSSSGEIVKEETHTKCPYCGSKYNKNSDSCPKCGASKID